ncbi:hypothetical protein PILCRDRAFT_1933 [Piloderma croceum F 1598]|uniref:Nephrocystin 3-like N-terminal domain-containing protein n=1 Tax=Piloderma croceum (strain F 1598) TaxID=765440 RepID=A0A0C3GD31_PILCF|nr:hypothetical protein PILCRDRAFT_1933 [Piloderma croceum F 1598]
MAWSILSAIPKERSLYAILTFGLRVAQIILAQVDRDSSIIHLVEVIIDVYSFLKEAEPIKKIESNCSLWHSKLPNALILSATMPQTKHFGNECSKTASTWTSIPKSNDTKISLKSSRWLFKITQFFRPCIFDDPENLAADFELNDMPYADGPRFDPDKGCLPGTREATIGEIVQWINSLNEDNPPRLFFLTAVAGYGQSAVAHAVARQFDELGRLGSSYCFDRANQANRNPRNLLSTVTLDIADLDHYWNKSLYDVVKEPVKALKTVGPVVIVIDAFDESKDISVRMALLDVLTRRATDLPTNFRVLITACPEMDILKAFSGKQHIHCRYLNDIDNSSNECDISLFIETKLSGVPDLEIKWPNKDWCRMLLEVSDGLFQWVSTVCRAIKDGQAGLLPMELLTRFSTAYDTTVLNELQGFIHHRLLYWLEVLSLIKNINIATRVLLSLQEWIKDRNVDIVSFVKDAIKLVSVFGPPISQSVPHIYLSALPFLPRHSLVAEHYLPQFPKTLHLKTGKADKWPAIIAVLEGHTDFVSCVAFLQDGKRIVSGSGDKTIRVWDVDTGDVVVGPLYGHASLLISVTFSQDSKLIVSGSGNDTIHTWDADTGDLIRKISCEHTDFVNFVAFSQDGKRIVSGSSDETIRIWVADTGHLVVRSLNGHTDSVNSVAFLQDGKWIVSGSSDKTICIWDTDTGDLIVGPLNGHTGWVNSVAFSQDDEPIVSGLRDETICIWDADTGDLVIGPLNGHTGPVNSVAFSQDGKRIVSGSYDYTIRIWDADTGHLVRPSNGHADFVNSITFSPDGKQIVSGSHDGTIHIWDADTGDLIVGPLHGHTNSVKSVAFSQDGKRIVSGSDDYAIRIWDVDTRHLIVEPLNGHTDSANPITSSQDGRQIVSGLDDQIICIPFAQNDDSIIIFHDGSVTLEQEWFLTPSSSLLFWVPC